MTKWHTLSARFAEEEVEVIQKYAKMNNLTDSQIVRNGVQLIVSMIAMKDLFNQPDMTYFRQFAEEMKQTMESPKMKKMMEEVAVKTAKKYKEAQLNQLEQEANIITKEIDVFSEKRKRGRKPIKKSRGRPKEKGI